MRHYYSVRSGRRLWLGITVFVLGTIPSRAGTLAGVTVSCFISQIAEVFFRSDDTLEYS